MTKEATTEDPPSEEVDDIVLATRLMWEITEATVKVRSIQADIDNHLTMIVADDGEVLTGLNERIAEAAEALECLCREHPEWFAKRKKIKTAFGTFGLQKSGKIVIPDAAATIRRIPRHGLVKDLIRKRDEIDLEACERLNEEWLEVLGIQSKTSENFKVTPLKTDTSKVLSNIKKDEASTEGQR